MRPKRRPAFCRRGVIRPSERRLASTRNSSQAPRFQRRAEKTAARGFIGCAQAPIIRPSRNTPRASCGAGRSMRRRRRPTACAGIPRRALPKPPTSLTGLSRIAVMARPTAAAWPCTNTQPTAQWSIGCSTTPTANCYLSRIWAGSCCSPNWAISISSPARSRLCPAACAFVSTCAAPKRAAIFAKTTARCCGCRNWGRSAPTALPTPAIS